MTQSPALEDMLNTLSVDQIKGITLAMVNQSLDFTMASAENYDEVTLKAKMEDKSFFIEVKRAWMAIMEDRMWQWLKDNGVLPDGYVIPVGE